MAGDSGRRYAIVTPVRNEARFIARTLESVTGQTEPPCAWIVVDDGSTDATAEIVERYAEQAGYIRLVQLSDNDRGDPSDRLMWAAEAIAFNAGLRQVDLDDIDYVVKLDGDLAFGPTYFSSLMDEFQADETLGMAGGYCYQIQDGKRVLEWNPRSHVRGPTKMYRVECFREIGGIKPVYAWDGLDELQAQMAGWRTQSFHFPVDHLKATGSVGGLAHAAQRMGKGAYLLGYHPLFMLARAGRLSLGKPYVGGLAFVFGYVRAAAARHPRVADRRTVRYLRMQQMLRLKSMGDLREVRSLLGGGR